MITKFNLGLNKIIKEKYPFKLLRRNRQRKKYKMKKLETLSLEFTLINIRNKGGDREKSLCLPFIQKTVKIRPCYRPAPHTGAFLSAHKRSVASTELYIPEDVIVNPCSA